MTDLDQPIEASYNGYEFSTFMETLGVEVQHVPDAAGRTVVRKVITVTIKDIIQRDAVVEGISQVDPEFDDVRAKLEEWGAPFVYQNAGLGSCDFNTKRKDLDWGPKTQMVSWKQKGGGNAIEFVVRITFSTLDKDGAKDSKGIMEFNYRLQFSYDDAGYLRRTYTGHIVIPLTRGDKDDRTLGDSIDEYRDKVWPQIPKGFRRLPGTWDISESKCRADFSIIDEEMPPNYPPPDVVKATARHSIESGEKSLFDWRGSITATYEMKKGVNGRNAAEHFFALVKDRLDQTIREGKQVVNQRADVAVISGNRQVGTVQGPITGKIATGKIGGTVVIPLKFSMCEPSIYGKTVAEFTLNYSFVTDISAILAASGLWRPVPNNDWKKWSTSLLSVINPWGASALKFDLKDDAIIDLGTDRKLSLPGGTRQKNIIELLAPKQTAFKFTELNKMEPKRSWIDYNAELFAEIIDDVSQHKLLPTQQVVPDQDRAKGPQATVTKATPVLYQPKKSTSIVQQRSGPTVILHFIGSAARAGFEIACPTIKAAMGSEAIDMNGPGNGFGSKFLANFGVPIVAARWHKRYILPDAPAGDLGAAQNLLLNHSP